MSWRLRGYAKGMLVVEMPVEMLGLLGEGAEEWTVQKLDRLELIEDEPHTMYLRPSKELPGGVLIFSSKPSRRKRPRK